MFGSNNNKPSLFGNSTTNTSGFGSSGFGSNPSGSSFGMGQQQNQTLFGGQTNNAFGSTNNSGGLFGQSQQTGGLFGSTTNNQTQTSAFGGQSTSAGFGTGGSLFSNNTNNTSQSIFGAPKFGSNTTTPFGSNTANNLTGNVQSVVGTTIKFNPVLSNDTMVKNGVNQSINTRHQCITCMKEYENKSLEELRWEDYQANRKGPQNSMFGGSTTTTQPSGGLFSTSTSTPSVSFNNNTGGSLFGQSKPAFGAPTTTTSTTSIFGNSSFGANKPFGTSTSAFGTQNQTAQPTSTPATGSLFGASTSTSNSFGQPNNNLFGMNNNQTANKPFFTATTNSQPSLFSNTSTTNNTLGAKPLFGTNTAGTTNAFGTAPTTNSSFSFTGANTTANPSATGGGLFANTQTTSLFGNNAAASNTTAAKPLFNFSSTSTGLGTTTNPLGTNTANTGTSLFNTNTGLGSNTLGTGSSMFGTSNQSTSLFGNSNTLTGSNLTTNTLGQNNLMSMQPLQTNQSLNPTAMAAPAQNTTDNLMTRLLMLPYGTSPLFQNQTTNASSGTSLKFTTDPKTLNQYKVNFSANASTTSGKSVRIPNTSNRNTSLLFEDYEDISQNEKKTASDIFVPRKSIKKLIIKPKEDCEKTITSSPSVLQASPQTNANKAPTLEVTTPAANDNHNPLDATVMEFFRNKTSKHQEGIHKPAMCLVPGYTSNMSGNNASPSSFNQNSSPLSSPDPLKALSKSPLMSSPQPSNDLSGNYSQNFSLIGQSDIGSPSVQYVPSSPVKKYKCQVISTRSNYFLIPSLEQLDTLVDEQQQTCIVNDFTVGRHDYGTIYWEGPLDVYGLNIDEIVHIRRKEVIVYPDDSDKAQMGTGLNRPAQITLHKVWPVDKTSRELIKDPERLERMGYEEKIELATIKFGGIFKEYRPETGTWVFCVKHFSKYGLADDDEDEDGTTQMAVNAPQSTFTSKMDNQTYNLNANSNAFKKPLQFSNTYNQERDLLTNKKLDLDFSSKELDSFIVPEEETRFSNLYRHVPSNTFNIFDEGEDEENEFEIHKHCANNESHQPEMMVDPVDTGYFASLRSALFESNAPNEDKPMGPIVKKSKKLLLIPDVFAKTETIDVPSPMYGESSVQSLPVKLNLVVKRVLPFDDIDVLSAKEQMLPVNDIGSIKFAPLPKIRFTNGGNRLLMIKGRQVQIHQVNLLDVFDAQTLNRFEHQLVENSMVSSCDPVSTYVQTKPTIQNSYNDVRLEKLIQALYSRLDIRDQSAYDAVRTNLILDWLCEQNLTLHKPSDLYSLIIHYLAGNDLKSALEVALRSRHPKLVMMLTCGNMFDCKTNVQQQLIKWRTNQLDRFIDIDLLRIYVLLSGQLEYKLSNGDQVHVLDGLQWTQQLSLMLLYTIHEGLQYCIDRLTCETNDVEYHLIAGNSPLTAMSATRNDLEAWFLHQSLKSYGVIDIGINSNVAHGVLCGQLLASANGIRWACFVAAHINDDLLRDYTINQLLLLYIPRLTRKDEMWLETQLLLPKHFVAQAKAVYAKSRFQYADLALQLIECRLWSDAHDTLLDHILPELVINEENDKLRQLVEHLKPNKHLISGWYPAGAHIYDIYCQCVQDDIIDDHLMLEPFDFEQMRTTNVRQVLCKSEMARKFNLIHHGITGDRFILNMPVPNDYALSEIKTNFITLLKKWSH